MLISLYFYSFGFLDLSTGGWQTDVGGQAKKEDQQSQKLIKKTMTRNLTIATRLRDVLLDGHWIANTNNKEQILSINWQQAVYKVNDLNTIAALVYYINYYLLGLLSAFKTGSLEIIDKYSFNLPPTTSKSDWENLATEFLVNAKEFADKVEEMEDKTFDQPFIDEKIRNIPKRY